MVHPGGLRRSTQMVRSGTTEFYVEVVDAGGPQPVTADQVLSFDGVRQTVEAIAEQLTRAWEKAKPSEATVEFGLSLTAKSGKLTGLLVDGAAEASLKELANVKEESRGVVITLSGSVLFATGKSQLLPIAQNKLAEVAKALSDQGYKSLLVEGHTDSQGSVDKNMALSQERAQSVRSYLVSQGIPSDKIRAEGIGSSRPVADNSTAEGRANNRRVEIVVEPNRK